MTSTDTGASVRPMTDTTWLDATAQAELVRSGQAGPAELVEAAIERIERVNPQLDAVIRDRFDDARAEAAGDLPDGPFRGVPMLLKDLGCHVAGERTDYGTSHLRDADVRWPTDSYLARHFRAAGFVFLGRTNVPEFGTTITTEPAAHRPTRNPWNPAHSAGGSSGGSAAAVAAGLVPIAHASDGGGSIRIPASRVRAGRAQAHACPREPRSGRRGELGRRHDRRRGHPHRPRRRGRPRPDRRPHAR